MNLRNIIFFIIICVAFSICAISYWPGMVYYDIYVSDLSDARIYYTSIAYACLGFVLLCSLPILAQSFTRLRSYAIFTVCILIGALLAMIDIKRFWGDEYSMVVAFVAFSAGICMPNNFKYFRTLFFLYSFVAMAVSYTHLTLPTITMV